MCGSPQNHAIKTNEALINQLQSTYMMKVVHNRRMFGQDDDHETNYTKMSLHNSLVENLYHTHRRN